MAYSQKLVARGFQYPIKGRDRRSVPRTCARQSLKLTKLPDSCRPFSIEVPVSPVAPRRSTFCLIAISQFRGLWEFEGGTDYQIDDPKLKSDINPGLTPCYTSEYPSLMLTFRGTLCDLNVIHRKVRCTNNAFFFFNCLLIHLKS